VIFLLSFREMVFCFISDRSQGKLTLWEKPMRFLTSLLVSFVVVFVAAAAERPPNVVVILADDQGWGDLSSNGNPNLRTPNIDSLARDGTTFDRFFVSPVCAPTRAEFMTGRFHSRTGVWGVSRGEERLNLDERTIADVFREAGYATGNFGKWHNGTQFPYHPNGRGFDEFYGFTHGHWGHYFSPPLDHNGTTVRGNGYVTDDFSERAMQFIEANQDKPFFAYVTYCTPHTPFQVPDQFFEPFADKTFSMHHRDPEKEEIERTRSALSMVENIDWNVGRILKRLEELDLDDDTIVVYFSDNGPNSWRWNGDMKGRKGRTDEGGVRVPCLIRWPGIIKSGRTVEGISGAIDLLPTLCELTGVSIGETKPLDGISQAEQLTAEKPRQPNDRMIYSVHGVRVGVRTQQYRLDEKGTLFDMIADPGQRVDISESKKQVADRLRVAVADFRAASVPESKPPPRPFTVGYRDFPVTSLPARDGIATGEIERSNRAPNCSFYTNWVNTDDVVSWDVAVNEAGTYAVTVYYTCPEEDVGATFEVSVGDAKVSGKITEPHDPPLVGKAEDRVDRGTESYMKDFRPLFVGELALESGRTTITIKPTNIPGSQAMDIQEITLELL